MIPTLVSIASAWVLGYLCVRGARIFAGGTREPGQGLWVAGLSLALGLGLTSVLQFVGRATLGASLSLTLALEAGTAVALVCFARRRGPLPSTTPGIPAPPSAASTALGVLLLLLAAAATGTFWVQYCIAPHGIGDAVDIWNLRARFLFRTDSLRAAIPFTATATHPDYPLLLPGSITRGWQHAGGETTWTPALLAFAFAGATATMLCGSLTGRVGRVRGRIATIALLGAPAFSTGSASQCADVPLACFILATLALVVRARRPLASPGVAVLAGLAAGLAAWTKNEGLLLAPAVLAAWWWRPTPGVGRRGALWFVAGAAPILLVVAWFKLGYAPDNDLVVQATGPRLVERLTDGSRYAAVLDQGYRFMVGPGLLAWVLLPVGLILLRRPRAGGRSGGEWTALVLILLMGGIHGLVYVASSEHIIWHLATSVDRLFLQWTPALVFALFVTQAPASTLGPPTSG